MCSLTKCKNSNFMERLMLVSLFSLIELWWIACAVGHLQYILVVKWTTKTFRECDIILNLIKLQVIIRRVSSSNIFSKDIYIHFHIWNSIYNFKKFYHPIFEKNKVYHWFLWVLVISVDYSWLVNLAETFTNSSEHYFDQMTYV